MGESFNHYLGNQTPKSFVSATTCPGMAPCTQVHPPDKAQPLPWLTQPSGSQSAAPGAIIQREKAPRSTAP